jgi:hypothetical protein
MPASLPGSTLAENQANPSAGRFVLFDLLSGPKGSPLDKDTTSNCSTGALSTGIGHGNVLIMPSASTLGGTAAQAIKDAGFIDDVSPTASATDSTRSYIGGGRSVMVNQAPPAGVAGTNPYTAGFGMGGAGNGGSRDAGAGPAFTGFPVKMVTAAGAVATAAAIETGFLNRTGVAMVATQSTYGSSNTASAAVA